MYFVDFICYLIDNKCNIVQQNKTIRSFKIKNIKCLPHIYFIKKTVNINRNKVFAPHLLYLKT